MAVKDLHGRHTIRREGNRELVRYQSGEVRVEEWDGERGNGFWVSDWLPHSDQDAPLADFTLDDFNPT